MTTYQTRDKSPALFRLYSTVLAFMLLVCAAPAFAQFSNGSFDQGAAGWTWRESHSISVFGYSRTPCRNQNLSHWQPQYFNFPGDVERGIVLSTSHWINYGSDYLSTCEEASQYITVPTNPKDLAFAYKLGVKIEHFRLIQNYRPVTLQVVVEPTDGSPSRVIFSKSGKSGRMDQLGQCTSFDCPVWEEARASLVEFAGKTVKIRFLTGSGERLRAETLGEPQSPAKLDDVRLVDAPPPEVSLSANPRQVVIPSSATSGTTRISWSSRHIDSLDLKVSIDGGPASPFQNNVAGQTAGETINWIEAGRSYVFTAIGRATPSSPVLEYARLTVTGVQSPTPTVSLTASPTEVSVPQGQSGLSQISWSSANLSNLDILVSVNGATPTTFAGNRLSGTEPADWIVAGSQYDFIAMGRETPTSALAEYARVTVYGVSACGSIGMAPTEGWYLDSARPNTALQVSPRGGSLILGWLTFDQGGTPTWYFGQPELDTCGNYAGPIYRFQRDPSTGAVSSSEVANVSLSFGAKGSGNFQYDFAGQSMTASIGYFQFGFNYGSLSITGFYADSTRANSGTYAISQDDLHLVANYVFDAGGNPTWTFGQGQSTGQTVSDVTMLSYYGTGRCPLCTGPAGPLGAIDLGDISMLPQGSGGMLINGVNGALSGNGVNWPFSYTPHGQL